MEIFADFDSDDEFVGFVEDIIRQDTENYDNLDDQILLDSESDSETESNSELGSVMVGEMIEMIYQLLMIINGW